MTQVVWDSTFTHWRTLWDLYNAITDEPAGLPYRQELLNLIRYQIKQARKKYWRRHEPEFDEREFWSQWKVKSAVWADIMDEQQSKVYQAGYHAGQQDAAEGKHEEEE
jgi:hypothetical protein